MAPDPSAPTNIAETRARKPLGRRLAVWVGAPLASAFALLGSYVFAQTRAFDASTDKVYDIPLPDVTHSTAPADIARGKHLAESFVSCARSKCHGADLGGGTVSKLGPVAVLAPPNISSGGLGAAYTDGELARLIRHGVKKDGRTVRFMPMDETSWLPDEDVRALLSYLRSMPPVDRPNGTTTISALGKVFDRRDQGVIDIARRIDHESTVHAPAPAPTAEYGAFLARVCRNCHGATFSGGAFPGAPASVPVPGNLTPDETGLKNWTYEDFDRLLTTGIRKNGKIASNVMPWDAYGKMDDTEKRALWLALRALPPVPFGNR